MYCSNCGNRLNNGICNTCDNKTKESIKEKTDSISFFMVNLIYIVLLFSLQFISLSNILNNLITNIILSLISVLLSYVYILSVEILFIKAKLPWFGVFIPIYGEYLMCKLCFKKGYIFLIPILSYIVMLLQTIFYMLGHTDFNIILFLICYIIFLIYSFMVLYKIGKRFGVSGWLSLFFIYIMLPILAFSNDYQYIEK